jgi:hypothetical protein
MEATSEGFIDAAAFAALAALRAFTRLIEAPVVPAKMAL